MKEVRGFELALSALRKVQWRPLSGYRNEPSSSILQVDSWPDERSVAFEYKL